MAQAQIPSQEATTAATDHDQHGDTVTVLGREVTVTGGIYTVVFVALGIVTLIEVLIGGANTTTFTIILIAALALSKASMVVLYYMHLRTDPRLFALILAVPLGIALLSVLYLVGVPSAP